MITINPDPDNPNMIYTCRIPENDILWVDITKTELIRRLNEYWNGLTFIMRENWMLRSVL